MVILEYMKRVVFAHIPFLNSNHRRMRYGWNVDAYACIYITVVIYEQNEKKIHFWPGWHFSAWNEHLSHRSICCPLLILEAKLLRISVKDFWKNIESFVFYSCFSKSTENKDLYHEGVALTRLYHKNGMNDWAKIFYEHVYLRVIDTIQVWGHNIVPFMFLWLTRNK